MATGGVTNYSCCSPCLDDGRNTVARHYCVDCEMYLCTKCDTFHRKFPATRKHQVNDVNAPDPTDVDDDTPSLQSDVPSESDHRLRCLLHRDKLIDTFCKDHNEVCCGACAVVKHRSCTTESTVVASKDFQASPERGECKTALTETTAKFIEEKKKRAENLDVIGKQKEELIEGVDKYEEKIIARIKELANISRSEIRTKYEEYKQALGMDIDTINVGLATNTEYDKQIEQRDEEQQFIYIKMNKAAIQDGEMLLQSTTMDCMKLEIRFFFDESLGNHILQMKSFGILDGYRAAFQKNIDIKQSGDLATNSYVRDACLLESGDLLVTDDYNMKLKRFDSDLQFKDDINISGKPFAICKINNNEVAVRIRNTKVVQFVSVGHSMQLTASFTLADHGFGMTYDAGTGELFACEEKKVNVYSKAGNKLKTFDKDKNGEQIFSQCRQIALCVDKPDIYVTDKDKGLIVLDRNGTSKMKVSLSDTWSLCLLPGGICLAGYQASGVFVQVDKDGKQVGNLIDTQDGRDKTFCAVYDRKHSRLVVGGSNYRVSVYTLSAR